MTVQDDEDYIDLEAHSQSDGLPVTARRLLVRIDDQSIRIEDPTSTGRQLLRAAGRLPVDEHLLFLVLRGGVLEEIRLDEVVDLRRPGAERFLSFKSAESHRFVVDGERKEWGATAITGLMIKKLAGVDPDEFALWREVRGGEDILIGNEEFINIGEEGLERFFTVVAETTAGASPLPTADREYLAANGYAYEEIQDTKRTGIVLKSLALPEGRYDAGQADVLILLPSGYPDVAPDMFYLTPWLRLVSRNAYPPQADQPFQFSGRNWQRWSRHNRQWRAGRDGIWTMIKRVEHAIGEAA